VGKGDAIMSYTEFLDLYDLLVNDVAGHEVVFIFMSYLAIAWGAAWLRFPNIVTIMIMALWSLLMSAYFSSILPLVLLAVGLFFARALFKVYSAN
jgi:hypothetical protein